jgi:ubiquinone/menaquinone biosynthesis C-methylase UbiE
MLPIHKIIWHEALASGHPQRVPEPCEAMEGAEQIRSYVQAYDWGGPFSALQLHHLRELSAMIRPGDTVLDLACGPGPLLLELAPLFPTCRFIGADLSRPMLDMLLERAAARGITNIEVLHEDIRTLPSLGNTPINMVITTLAMHHLPNLDDLGQTFRRVNELLGSDGGFYIFDFGLLRSARTQALLMKEAAKTAPPATIVDYGQSLRAAFPVEDVLRLARKHLPKPFKASSSCFVDFLYFLQSPPRTTASAELKAHRSELWKRLSTSNKIEHLMLRLLRRAR